mgnify:CR=1 FL=1
MKKIVCLFFAVFLTFAAVAETPEAPAQKTRVHIIPVKGEIHTAQFYILRRALKEAEREQAAVVLDMDTPGGALDSTLEMMEALDNFSGLTITFVDKEAVSAGSYIAVATNEIWFAPKGVMGAAEAVSATGESIPESMKRKLNSFLSAKVRSFTEGTRYRAEVQRAMMDSDFELEIDGTVLKKKGELLSLTATEAMKEYGEPPQSVLAAGVADNVDDLLQKRFGPGNYERHDFQLTGAEQVAVWLKMIAPLLLGIGVLSLYIEFKTPGFGIFGVVGIVCLSLFFLSNVLAGLAGYEPLLVFLLGVVLLALELYFLQGFLVSGITALLLIVGAVLWSGLDIWPQQDFKNISWDWFLPSLLTMLYAALVMGAGVLLIAKFLPKRVYVGTLVLDKALKDEPTPEEKFPAIGSRGAVLTALRPEGEVQIEGRRYPARARIGELEKGDPVEIVAHDAFAVVVKKAD